MSLGLSMIGGGLRGVASFNGRTGAVVPEAGDYDATAVGAETPAGAQAKADAAQAAAEAYADALAAANALKLGQNVFFVGKHGDTLANGATGQNWDLAFNNFQEAANAASSGDVVVCLDDGNYTGDLTLPSGVDLFAKHASIDGKLTLNGGCEVTLQYLTNVSDPSAGTPNLNINGSYSDVETFTTINIHEIAAYGDKAIRVNATAGKTVVHLNCDHIFTYNANLSEVILFACVNTQVDFNVNRIESWADNSALNNIILLWLNSSCSGTTVNLRGTSFFERKDGTGSFANSTAIKVESGTVRGFIGGITVTGNAYDISSGAILQAYIGQITGNRINAGIANIMLPTDRREPQSGFLYEYGVVKSAANAPLTLSLTGNDLTLTPTGSVYEWIDGTGKHSSSGDTITLSATAGKHYIYYENGTLTQSTAFNPDIITRHAYIAYAYYTGSAWQVGYELHGSDMASGTHFSLHNANGSTYLNGMLPQGYTTVGDGTANADAQVGIASGSFLDEDIQIDLDTLGAGSTVEIAYLSNGTWQFQPATEIGLTTGSGRLAYNNISTPGGESLTEATNNRFVLMHLVASNFLNLGTDATKAKFVWITGQAEYLNASDARNAAKTEGANLIRDFLPTEESSLIATFLLQTNDSYTNNIKAKVAPFSGDEDFVDFRGQGDNITGVGASSVFSGNSADISTADSTFTGALSGLTTQKTVNEKIDSDLNKKLNRMIAMENMIQINTMRDHMRGDVNYDSYGNSLVNAFSQDPATDPNINSAQMSYNATEDYYSPATSTVITQTTTNTLSALGNQNGTQVAHAQRIQFATDTTIVGAEFQFDANLGNPGNYTGVRLRIETDNAGVPSGNLVHPDSTGVEEFPVENSWNAIYVNHAFTCLAGVDYWLVLEAADTIPDSNNAYIINISQSAGSYPNGYKATRNNGIWSQNATWDMTFRVFGASGFQNIVSNAIDTDTPPNVAKILTITDQLDATAPSVTYEVSRDGSTWATATLSLIDTQADGKRVYSSTDIDLSAQSGNTIYYRIVSESGQFHAVSVMWREA